MFIHLAGERMEKAFSESLAKKFSRMQPCLKNPSDEKQNGLNFFKSLARKKILNAAPEAFQRGPRHLDRPGR